MKQTLILFALFFSIHMIAQRRSYVVNLEKPGTLRGSIAAYNIQHGEKLTITGPMNNDDISFLMDALYSKDDYNECVEKLDLSEVLIRREGSTNYHLSTEVRLTLNKCPHGPFRITRADDELPWLTFARFGSLRHIQLPKVRFIDNGVLHWAINLEEIVVPEGVDSIMDYFCFDATAMKQAYLPSTLKYLGKRFAGRTTALQRLVCAAPTPPEVLIDASIGTFSYLDAEHCDLYVPTGSKELYEAAEGWNQFRSITECDTEAMRTDMELASNGSTTGIGHTHQHAAAAQAETYNLKGQRTNTGNRGLCIVRNADGTVRKRWRK